MTVFADLGRALAQLGDPRFLRVLLKAVAASVAALVAVSWGALQAFGWLLPEAITLPWIGPVAALDDVLSWAAVVAMLGLSMVLMVPAAAVAVGFFLDDVAAAVEARHYPRLPPARALSFSAQIRDSLRFFALVVVANLGALLIYLLVAPLAPFVFWLVNGFLLGREYFTLVALRRLPTEDVHAMRRRHTARIWALGTAMAVPLSVPLLNLMVPLLGVAVFTHQFHRLAPRA